MTISRAMTMVSTQWLKGQLGSAVTKTAPRHLRVLDTSFDLDRTVDARKELYLPHVLLCPANEEPIIRSHIPQSVHFDIYCGLPSTPEFPVQLPDTNRFTDYVQSLGVSNDTHVVTYDRNDPKSAFRAWWMFRLFGHKNVSVLDGGIQKWIKDGYDVTSDVPEIERSNFEATYNKNLLRTLDDVVRNCESQQEQLVEARATDNPTCLDKETGGTIKDGVHVSFLDIFNDDGTLKSDKELRALFDNAGVELSKPMMITCLRGLTACGVAAAAEILGQDNVPIYAGSWSEFFLHAPAEYKIPPKET